MTSLHLTGNTTEECGGARDEEHALASQPLSAGSLLPTDHSRCVSSPSNWSVF